MQKLKQGIIYQIKRGIGDALYNKLFARVRTIFELKLMTSNLRTLSVEENGLQFAVRMSAADRLHYNLLVLVSSASDHAGRLGKSFRLQ